MKILIVGIIAVMFLCSVVIAEENPAKSKKKPVRNQMRELKGKEKMRYLRDQGMVLVDSTGKSITNEKEIEKSIKVRVGHDSTSVMLDVENGIKQKKNIHQELIFEGMILE